MAFHLRNLQHVGNDNVQEVSDTDVGCNYSESVFDLANGVEVSLDDVLEDKGEDDNRDQVGKLGEKRVDGHVELILRQFRIRALLCCGLMIVIGIRCCDGGCAR